jgi:hypothetical protein
MEKISIVNQRAISSDFDTRWLPDVAGGGNKLARWLWSFLSVRGHYRAFVGLCAPGAVHFVSFEYML